MRLQGFLNCRNLWLSHFVTVQNATSQIDFIVTEGVLLSAKNMFTSKSDPFNKVSWVHRLWALTGRHTHKHIYQWNNTKIGKNTTFHIHVKSEPGFSPKYPEHVFSVNGLILWRHGHDHKMQQITKCDVKDSWIVAVCDCRILWRFKMQLLRFMSVVQEGILLSAGNMYTSTSDTINKVSFVNRLWAL